MKNQNKKKIIGNVIKLLFTTSIFTSIFSIFIIPIPFQNIYHSVC